MSTFAEIDAFPEHRGGPQWVMLISNRAGERSSLNAPALADRLGNWLQGQGPLHRRLAMALEEAIRQGVLTANTRLPGERSLAVTLAVSRTTVISAYDTLLAHGGLQGRGGSGTWVAAEPAQAARREAHRAALEQTPLINLLQIDDNSSVDFALATPKPLTELPAELYAVGPALQRALLDNRNYMPFGFPPLREAIARQYSRQKVPTRAEQILVTSGAQQAIHLVVSLFVRRADSVVIETPSYFGALSTLRLRGARLTGLEVGERHVDVETLRDTLKRSRPSLIHLTPSFHNPTGAVMSRDKRLEIVQLAREAGVILVEDAALSELSIDDRETPPYMAANAPEDTVLTIGSLSKLFWAGLRIGWIRGPVETIQQLTKLKGALDLGSPVMTQGIAAQLLTAVDLARSVRREQLGRRRDYLASLLREFLPQWHFRRPGGGLFLWVRVPGNDTRALAQSAARRGVALTPGALFSVDGTNTQFLRIPFLLEKPLLRLGVERLAAAWYGRPNASSTQAPRDRTLAS